MSDCNCFDNLLVTLFTLDTWQETWSLLIPQCSAASCQYSCFCTIFPKLSGILTIKCPYSIVFYFYNLATQLHAVIWQFNFNQVTTNPRRTNDTDATTMIKTRCLTISLSGSSLPGSPSSNLLIETIFRASCTVAT